LPDLCELGPVPSHLLPLPFTLGRVPVGVCGLLLGARRRAAPEVAGGQRLGQCGMGRGRESPSSSRCPLIIPPACCCQRIPVAAGNSTPQAGGEVSTSARRSTRRGEAYSATRYSPHDFPLMVPWGSSSRSSSCRCLVWFIASAPSVLAALRPGHLPLE